MHQLLNKSMWPQRFLGLISYYFGAIGWLGISIIFCDSICIIWICQIVNTNLYISPVLYLPALMIIKLTAFPCFCWCHLAFSREVKVGILLVGNEMCHARFELFSYWLVGAFISVNSKSLQCSQSKLMQQNETPFEIWTPPQFFFQNCSSEPL